MDIRNHCRTGNVISAWSVRVQSLLDTSVVQLSKHFTDLRQTLPRKYAPHLQRAVSALTNNQHRNDEINSSLPHLRGERVITPYVLRTYNPRYENWPTPNSSRNKLTFALLERTITANELRT